MGRDVANWVSMTQRPVTPDELYRYCEALEQQNAQLKAQLQRLQEQLLLAQKHRFGRSSERIVPGQLQFVFNEVETEAKPEEKEPELETVGTYKRKKKRRSRSAVLEGVPTEQIHYTLPEEQQHCPQCAGRLHAMRTEVRRELQVIPAQVKVIEHVQHLYACRACDHGGTSTPIVKVPMPKPPIPGSYASASAIAHVINEKYVQGVPLYRQEQELRRLGVGLSRQTLANWTLEATERHLALVYDHLHRELLKWDILQADETTVQVLQEPDRAAQTPSYMWLYRTGRDGPPIVLFDYEETRSGQHPVEFLSGFSGYLQVDGYAGYEKIPHVTLVGCWAHARRGFVEALAVLPKEERTNGTSATAKGLAYCNHLFEIKRELKELSPEERKAERLAHSVPVLNEFHAWLTKQSTLMLPKSAFGKAVTYCLNQWDKLQGYLLDGRLEIDNNRAERAIKPFVIGRKNWLFSNTPRGARTSAILYSIVETAKENGLKPFNYITYLLERMPNLDLGEPGVLDSLMPWSESLPASFRTPQKPA